MSGSFNRTTSLLRGLLLFQVLVHAQISGAAQTDSVWGTVRHVLPPYPADQPAKGTTAEVVLDIKINKQGQVVSAEFAGGTRSLGEPCRQAARQWVFIPVLQKGKPAETAGKLSFTFQADGSVITAYTLKLPRDIRRDPLPEAMLPVSPEEKLWWERVRQAARNFRSVAEKFETSFRNTVSGRDLSEAEEEAIRTRTLAGFQPAFDNAWQNLLDLLHEAEANSWRIPLHNHKPVLLHYEMVRYTESARRNKVEGIVSLDLRVSADGLARASKVRLRLPDGLTEKCVRKVEHFFFFPASENGKVVPGEVEGVDFTFRVY